MSIPRSNARKAVVGIAVSCLVIGLAVSATDAAAQTATSSDSSASAPSQPVIVLLRDQLSKLPANRAHISARTAQAGSEQDAVLGQLHGPAATHVKHFALGNAFAARVTADQVAALRADPSVASVVPDVSVPMPDTAPLAAGATTPFANAVSPNDDASSICPSNPADPLLEPEALSSIHALTTDGSPNAQQLSTGAGVKVAFIADGIDPDNPDFIRPDSSHVIIDYQDFSGDGPDAPSGGAEAFGDASSIAAQGTVSHDLSQFVNQAHPLPPGCNIKIVGAAPGASIVALKAGGEFLTNSSILQSIDYAVRVDHVDVINESFGLNQFPDDSSRSTIELFNDAAVAAGVTITESSGDGGVTGTIGSDAQDPHVISVGATTDNRLYAQTTYAAEPFSNGKWISDNISALSSSGVTQLGRTVDLVAPGEGNWAACEPGFSSCFNFQSPPQPTDIQSFGGTSEAAPLTAGVAALVISAYRSTHGGASPTPAVVKQIITGTAGDLGLPPAEQGSGLLNARAATEAAMTWPGSTDSPSGLAANLVTSTDQVTLDGLPGTTKGGSFTVTNVGDTPTTVAAGTRGFSQLSAASQAIPFDATTLPTFVYYNGQQWAYKKVTFSVPAGTARLVEQMAWAGSRPPAADAVVRLTLLAPDGTFVANSRPQGGAASANYANVDVRSPAAGTWTAVMYSAAGTAGYTGVIGLLSSAYKAVPVGTITPGSFTLAPGASRSVHYSFTLPNSASGDQTEAITLADSAGRQTAVGAVVRTSIDTSSGQGSFSGVVTGGNARAVTPGETFSYDFRVPAGAASLDASLTFPRAPDSVIDLVLIDSNGELADVATNETVNVARNGLQLSSRIQSFTANPVGGVWHLVVVVQNPVSGTMFEQPFTGSISFDPVPVDTGGLPNSTSTTLTRGVAHSYTISVTNSGVQPILIGVDPRLSKQVTLQPVPFEGVTTFALPPDPAQEPTYNIPPDTSSLSLSAVSSTPAQLELQGSAAGFDLFGDLAQAQSGDLVSTASVSESGPRSFISKGIWFSNMQQLGPFTDAGAPAGTSTITGSMRTLAFDSSVTSSTGDPYGNAVDPTNNGFGNPMRIMPGATKSFTVTITPTAAAGHDVSGIINLVTVPNLPSGAGSLPFTTTGEVVAVLPYAYQVVAASS